MKMQYSSEPIYNYMEIHFHNIFEYGSISHSSKVYIKNLGYYHNYTGFLQPDYGVYVIKSIIAIQSLYNSKAITKLIE